MERPPGIPAMLLACSRSTASSAVPPHRGAVDATEGAAPLGQDPGPVGRANDSARTPSRSSAHREWPGGLADPGRLSTCRQLLLTSWAGRGVRSRDGKYLFVIATSGGASSG